MSESVHRAGSRKRWRCLARTGGGTALLLTVAVSFAVPSVRSQEHLDKETAKEQLEERKRELDAARQREEALSDDVETLAKERAELNEKLIATAARIQAREAKLSEIEKRLEQLESQQAELRASIGKRHDAIAKLLSAMQSMGREPPPALITQREDALAMVRSAMLLASIFPELKFQAESLSDDLSDLVRLGEGIREERAAHREETQKLRTEQLRIAGLIEQKKKKLALNKEELNRIRAAAKRHAEEVQFLGELLERMKKEIASAKADLEQAEPRGSDKARGAPQTSAPAPGTVELKPEENKQYALLSPGRIKPATPFEEAKGALPRPVYGETVLEFGDDGRHGAEAEGQWMRTRENAQVTSPADGWIVYAGDFRSYGQLLIIDAGGGYHVLLAGMERIDVDVGQFVLASEPVGVMGTTASQDEQDEAGTEKERPILYIEFRKDGRPVNPEPWWAESPEKVQG